MGQRFNHQLGLNQGLLYHGREVQPSEQLWLSVMSSSFYVVYYIIRKPVISGYSSYIGAEKLPEAHKKKPEHRTIHLLV